ncbi:MAG: hypothetical protein LRY53_08095 [Burkholderiaceae bacterium]|nr:hypothetical protein [Burkholderiaceae bacterium]MCD8565583.1 hypothetical protein [Burkholderiaceae bacterium]
MADFGYVLALQNDKATIMFVRMITYDSSHGDAYVFDDYIFSAETYDEFILSVRSRFESLIENRALIIDRESGFLDLVEPHSGDSAESYIIAYRSEQDVVDRNNGLELANSIFYDPDKKEMSCRIEVYSFRELLWDAGDGVLEAWGLEGILENPPPQLDVNSAVPGPRPSGWDLTKFFFELYQSRLASQ